jgi:hypothetical protein
MIRYALACEHSHEFEAWFASSDAYDNQAARGLVECPLCASTTVRKQIMAPAVAGTKKRGGPSPQEQAMMMEAASKARRHIEDNFDYVGDSFAREARDIHDGVSPERAIYGEAKAAEVRSLIEDGVPVAPIPQAIAPRRKTQVN